MKDHNEVATPELIVRQAARLFREKTYHGTTMRDIGKAVGLDKSSLYHHFPSKQAILERIMQDTSTVFLPYALTIADSEISPEEKLRGLIRNRVMVMSEYRDDLLVALTDNRGLTFENEKRRSSALAIARYQELTVRIITEGVKSGVWKTDNPVVTALFVLGALGWMAFWYDASGKLSPEEMADRLCDFVLSGLRSSSVDARPNTLIATT